MISAILFYLTFLVNIVLAVRVSIVFIFVLYQFYYFFNPEWVRLQAVGGLLMGFLEHYASKYDYNTLNP